MTALTTSGSSDHALAGCQQQPPSGATGSPGISSLLPCLGNPGRQAHPAGRRTTTVARPRPHSRSSGRGTDGRGARGFTGANSARRAIRALHQESWFVARCHHDLALCGIRGVVSFSDPLPRHRSDGTAVMPGHVSTVYQALSFQFTQAAPQHSITMLPDGSVMHGRALAKIRAQHTGHRYAERVLEGLGAPAVSEADDPAAVAAPGARGRRCGQRPPSRQPPVLPHAWRAPQRVAPRARSSPRTGPPVTITSRSWSLWTLTTKPFFFFFFFFFFKFSFGAPVRGWTTSWNRGSMIGTGALPGWPPATRWRRSARRQE